MRRVPQCPSCCATAAPCALRTVPPAVGEPLFRQGCQSPRIWCARALELRINYRAPGDSSALSFIGGIHIGKSAACLKFDMVWLYRSPIPVRGGEGVISSFKLFLLSLLRVVKGGGVGTLWPEPRFYLFTMHEINLIYIFYSYAKLVITDTFLLKIL